MTLRTEPTCTHGVQGDGMFKQALNTNYRCRLSDTV